jgi:Nuclease-related domain
MHDLTLHDPARRSPGQYARATVQRLRMRTLVTLGAMAVATAILGKSLGLHDPRFIGSELALLLFMLAISRYVLPLVERRDRGARGEESVGAILGGLEEGQWSVIHDATFGRGNIDHIVIGPPGIFTIETKSHPGPIRVRRIHGTILLQALAHSEALSMLTDLDPEPLIVYSRAWIDRPLARRSGVRVVPAGMLLGYLERLERQLSPEEIREARELVARALRETYRPRRVRLERFQLTP